MAHIPKCIIFLTEVCISLQEEDIRTVSVKGTEVPIKNVTLEDSTGKSKVTLWRDAAQACVKTGDYVVLTDVVVNTYKNETSLSSTSRTKVEVCISLSNVLSPPPQTRINL